MPIYSYTCKCGVTGDEFQQMGAEVPLCPRCGLKMERVMTYPSMVKVKGSGGYPSRRKEWKGSAPYTTRSTRVFPDNIPEANTET